MKKIVLTLIAGPVAIVALSGVQAQATIVTYSGVDGGAPTSGPWPNSASAQASFLSAASAFDHVATATFEDVTTGFYTPVAAGYGLSIAIARARPIMALGSRAYRTGLMAICGVSTPHQAAVIGSASAGAPPLSISPSRLTQSACI
jgi:hypothetical protein